MDDFDAGIEEAYGATEKPAPPVRDVRLTEMDERFLQNLEKGVLYRVRR